MKTRRPARFVFIVPCLVLVATFALGPAGSEKVETVAGSVPDRGFAASVPPETAADGVVPPWGSSTVTTSGGAVRATIAPRPGAQVGVSSAGPQPAPPGPAPAGPPATHHADLRGPLRTEGNHILDANGNPVVLRGINRVGLHEAGAAPPITDAEIGHAQDWGANVIRVLMSEAYSDPRCPSQYDAAYLPTVDAAVHSITSRGMVALLDLHTVTRQACGQNGRWRMADAPGSIMFWQTVAARYRSDPLVAFDLYNEPHDVTNDQWRNGGVLVDRSAGSTVQWTAAGMQQLYDAVRSTGAENLVVVSGNRWAADPSPIVEDGGLDATNIVYGVHLYTCSHVNDPVCTLNPANKTAQVGHAWVQVAAMYPVMVSEFGWPDPRSGSFNESVIRIAESQNPPWGWIAFAWDGTDNNNFILVGDLQTYAPTASGAPVKAALGRVP